MFLACLSTSYIILRRSREQKPPQGFVCFLGSFFGKKMAAWKCLTTHIAGSFTPRLQDIVGAADKPSLAPEGKQGTGHLLIEIGLVVLEIDCGGCPVIFTTGMNGCWIAEAAKVFYHCFRNECRGLRAPTCQTP